MTEFLTQWHTYFMNPDRIPTIIFAMLICMVLGMITGPVAGNANPFVWIIFDKLFGGLGDRLNRTHRKKADRVMRGFFLSVFVIVFAALIGKLLALASFIEPAFGITKILTLCMLFSTGTIWFIMLRLYFALDQQTNNKKMNEGAYYAIARSTRTNLTTQDDFGITRTAIGFSAKSLDKALIAPALWYLIAGLPAAMIYSALAMLTWRFGKGGTSTGFASIPMAMERLMGFVPNILTAALITASAALTPTAKLHKGVAAWLGHKDRSPYEQGGFPLSALAWGLNISLGGATQDLNGNAIKGEWIGPKGATAMLEHTHLRRALYINIIAHILFIAALLGIYVWSGVLLAENA